MSTLHGRTRVANGEFRIPLPKALNGQDVEYTLTVEPARPRGPDSAKPPITQAEWRAHLDRFAGTIDDPTFERPPQGEFEEREDLE